MPQIAEPAPLHPARLNLTLSLGPIVGLGIGRFAYALVLPDMRESLHWSYSAAGFMNTVNAAGYLLGALLASHLIRRIGGPATVRGGTLAALASLAVCATTDAFVGLSLARLVAGIGAGVAFVAGGALAARVAQSRPAQASFILSLFYAGPPLGIVASGLVAPFVLQAFGPGSWWIVWLALTALGAVLIIPLLLTPIPAMAAPTSGRADHVSLRPMTIFLFGYFLYGAGYIAYLTFMIAYVRDLGGGAAAQSAFWCLIGLAGFTTPWVWRRVLALDRGGVPAAIILTVNAVGATLPVLSHTPVMLAISAAVFGIAFSTVTTATTAFVRFNLPQSAWPRAIAALTIVFGIGQTLGPFVVGAITDAFGSLGYALNVSAALLLLAAVMAAMQGKLAKPAS
ncbi:YbfB/YjiJ family MFS transporter [Bradyrhizobium ontarionense]|uniref:YbfB/YjiJ family MFS transporter n=1 Tax=Bradyrhizobium ontarionense TaxID=2898149 RepID=A0ABY3R3W9_9BRAD|nr:YbfB/YjiJ family MFS transporter [Bradyrhizobium sp. A19]UFZ01971.1 YbfB/YjiJ family MFS transporter [Bradyrhizobium sp. A19]